MRDALLASPRRFARRPGRRLPAIAAWLAWLAPISLACSPGGSDPGSGEAEVQVRVERVGLDANDLPVVLLEEHGGERALPIWIGPAEARSIALEIEHFESPRPNTHDLAQRVIDGLRGAVERVVVTDLRAGTYYATLTLRADGRRVEIDSRPSDAIAIALRTGAPIFVRTRLFETSSRLPTETGREHGVGHGESSI